MQVKPENKALTLWRKYLLQAFGNQLPRKRLDPIRLRTPLGRWIGESHLQYEFYWWNKELFRRRGHDSFDIHNPCRLSGRIFLGPSSVGPKPKAATPVQVTVRRGILMVRGGLREMVPSPPRADMTAVEHRLLLDSPSPLKYREIIGNHPTASRFHARRSNQWFV